jgi:hypothetical protein
MGVAWCCHLIHQTKKLAVDGPAANGELRLSTLIIVVTRRGKGTLSSDALLPPEGESLSDGVNVSL